jgi:hypothetical protein
VGRALLRRLKFFHQSTGLLSMKLKRILLSVAVFGALASSPSFAQVLPPYPTIPYTSIQNGDAIQLQSTRFTLPVFTTLPIIQQWLNANGTPTTTGPNTWSATQTFSVAPVFTDQPGSRAALGVAPTVTSNAALSLLSTLTVPYVYRSGYATAGDSPTTLYKGASSCPYNGGVADGGSCVASADSKFWVAQFSGPAVATVWCGTCSGDVTTAFQAFLNYGGLSLYIPAGSYTACGLVIPNTAKLDLGGAGNSTVLNETSGCSSPLLGFPTVSIAYPEGAVHDMLLSGTAGSAHLLSLTGIGGETIRNIAIGDIPSGKSGVYVSGVGTTDTHDIRIDGLQVYSSTAGHSGVRWGPYSADSSLTNFIMNGEFQVLYGEYFDSNTTAIVTSGSHPYNIVTNTLYGSPTYSQFINNTFDNAESDVVHLVGASHNSFIGGYVEAINSGFNGINLDNTQDTQIIGVSFGAFAGAVSTVVETNGSAYNTVIGGTVTNLANYSAPLNLTGTNSTSWGFAGITQKMISFGFSGTAASAQGTGTTAYLGVNGSQSSAGATNYFVPANGTCYELAVGTDYTPTGGTDVITLYDGVTVLWTGTITNGNYGISASNLALSVSKNDTLYFKSVLTGTQTLTPRYWLNCRG